MEQNNQEEISEVSSYFKNHFIEENGLKNSEFSEGINHWGTSKGDELYNGSISNITLNKGGYHSSPQSLQITCSEPFCGTYYNTKSNSSIIKNISEFNSGIWIGIKPETELKISYWYTGCEHEVSFLALDEYGGITILKSVINKVSEKWSKKEVVTTIPENVIAFGITISIGEGGCLLVDDIQLEKKFDK